MTLVESALEALNRMDGNYIRLDETFNEMVRSYKSSIASGGFDGDDNSKAIAGVFPFALKMVTEYTASIVNPEEQDRVRSELLNGVMIAMYEKIGGYNPNHESGRPLNMYLMDIIRGECNHWREKYYREYKRRPISLDAPRGSSGDDDDGELMDTVADYDIRSDGQRDWNLGGDLSLPDVPTDEDNLDADLSGGDDVGGEALGGRPDQNIGRKENLAKLKEFIGRITNKPGSRIPNGLSPQEARIAFELMSGNGEDAKEMAERLGIAYGTLRQAISTLKMKLRKHVSLAREMGITGVAESKKGAKKPEQVAVTEGGEPNERKEKSFIEEMVEEWIHNPQSLSRVNEEDEDIEAFLRSGMPESKPEEDFTCENCGRRTKMLQSTYDWAKEHFADYGWGEGDYQGLDRNNRICQGCADKILEKEFYGLY